MDDGHEDLIDEMDLFESDDDDTIMPLGFAYRLMEIGMSPSDATEAATCLATRAKFSDELKSRMQAAVAAETRKQDAAEEETR